MFPKFFARETLSLLLPLVVLYLFGSERYRGRLVPVLGDIRLCGCDGSPSLAGRESHASNEANHHQRYEDTLFLSHKGTINYVFHFVLVLC